VGTVGHSLRSRVVGTVSCHLLRDVDRRFVFLVSQREIHIVMDKLLAFLILNDTKKGVIDSVVLKLVIVYFLFLFLATLKQILTEILHV